MSSKNVKIAQPYAEAFLELSSKGSLDSVIILFQLTINKLMT